MAQVQRHFSSSARRGAEDVYILGASRTPTGKFNGAFTSIPAPHLAATAIKSALTKSRVPVSKIREVYLGNVLQAAIGQSPARQAVVADTRHGGSGGCGGGCGCC
ncbi:hypothetical protein KEM55_006945 [Ascosphaera atra]|nr:hypothetical protein KEM55_006945 [Ascosphaera atra]